MSKPTNVAQQQRKTIGSPSPPPSPPSSLTSDEKQSDLYAWQPTWRAFQRALYAPADQTFNPFVWIYRLATAALSDSFHWCGGSTVDWRAGVPLFSIGLVSLVVLAYVTTLRQGVVGKRWCRSSSSNNSSSDVDESSHVASSEEKEEDAFCYWFWFHDFLVFYLSGMTLFHYLSAVVASPGYVIVPNSDANQQQLPVGGFWGCRSVRDAATEQARVKQVYNTTSDSTCTKTDDTTTTTRYFPDAHDTFCQHCQIWRPPRCHHCSTCQCCVLQFDHHCIWLNTCVGYNNYRPFFGTLFFIMISCWYGVITLFFPFYEPLRAQIIQHGFQWLYPTHGTGFLDLPPLWDLARMLLGYPSRTGSVLTTKNVIDLVYPLLLGVGAIMTEFTGQHLKYILRARTTLEHRILLDEKLVLWKKRAAAAVGRSTTGGGDSTSSPTTVNPFDQGWVRNMSQIIGPHWWLLLLPVRVTPPLPYLPQPQQQQSKNRAAAVQAKKSK